MAGTCCNLSQIMSDPLFTMEVSAVETLFEAGDVLRFFHLRPFCEQSVSKPKTLLNFCHRLSWEMSQNVPMHAHIAGACSSLSKVQFGPQNSGFFILTSGSGMMLCGPIAEAETCENCSLQDQVTRSKRCMRPLSPKRPLPKRSNSMALSRLSPQWRTKCHNTEAMNMR